MADPQTPNIGVYVPAVGSLPGTWYQPLNANFSVTDSLASNVATIGLTNQAVTLTTPPNTGAAWNGPYQSQSALLRFTGTLTGNCSVTVPRRGFFICENRCTVGNFYVQLTTGVIGGKVIGLPPGKKCHVFSDGTDMDFVDMPDPGTAYDLHGATSLPAWMTACSTFPYLLKDGTVYNVSDYPALGAILKGTFGGNGITTFAVPDERARARIGYDNAGTGRLTPSVSGMNGGVMGSFGGDQATQAHSHGSNALYVPNHGHPARYALSNDSGLDPTGGIPLNEQAQVNVGAYTGPPTSSGGQQIGGSGDLPIAGSIGVAFSGASQNVQPSIVSFIPLIKT